MPEGQGQIIAGVGYVAATRTFDKAGKPTPAPAYREIEGGLYAEYGLTDWLTVIAAPSVSRMQAGAPARTETGSDESALGARLAIWRTPTQTLALQALIAPPLGKGNPASEAAFGAPRALAADLRLQYARAFGLFGVPAFVVIEPGGRLRGEGWPDEARFDASFGLRPTARLLILAQSFSSLAPAAGIVRRTAYDKLQLSLVYDLTPAWSVQIGGLRTLFGENAAREIGPFGNLWYRF